MGKVATTGYTYCTKCKAVGPIMVEEVAPGFYHGTLECNCEFPAEYAGGSIDTVTEKLRSDAEAHIRSLYLWLSENGRLRQAKEAER